MLKSCPIVKLSFFSFFVTRGSTVVNHLPRHPEVKGLSPVEAAGTVGEKMDKSFFFLLLGHLL